MIPREVHFELTRAAPLSLYCRRMENLQGTARKCAAWGLLALVAVAWAGGPAKAQNAQPQRPVVIELFTSQGCSSCPPADRLLGKLARRPGVYALSLPVDLWDYVGWKDTLATPLHSQRQRHYAKGRGDNRVYTPQAIINGIEHVVGSDPAAIQAKAEECYGREGALSVDMKVEAGDGGLKVDLGAATSGAPTAANLWLVRVASSRDVQIKRGENAGHTFTYINVARSFSKIGDWSGEARSFSIPKDQLADAETDGWMLLLQVGAPMRPGVILAAAKSPGL